MTPADRSRGLFVTIEGGEGGGKSTQAKALVQRLADVGIKAIATREPGGSQTAELIRKALLDGTFERLGPKTEALLFAAARIDHIDACIKPALKAGTWVVSDRFHDSTRAYQGATKSIETSFFDSLDRVSLAGLQPDLTFILDLPATVGLARADARRGRQAPADRFERQDVQFHKDLRDAFLEIAKQDPDRCVVIDAAQPPERVADAIWNAIGHRFSLPEKTSRD